MNPFQFTEETTFTCEEPKSFFTFSPNLTIGKFRWVGAELDKMGTYEFVEREVLYLDLVWNYSREMSYIILEISATGEEIAAFKMKDMRIGTTYLFNRVR